MKDEERSAGSVSWAVHLAYLRAMGGYSLGVLLLLGLAWERSVLVCTDYWLALWIDPSSSALGQHTPPASRYDFWISIYFGGAVLAGISVYFRSLLMGVCMGLRAARLVYTRLSSTIMRAARP